MSKYEECIANLALEGSTNKGTGEVDIKKALNIMSFLRLTPIQEKRYEIILEFYKLDSTPGYCRNCGKEINIGDEMYDVCSACIETALSNEKVKG
ncbi:MAG: hypothetical protein GY853_01265 [PVC group bacterium]|nr:hypothetical protein [PVC group bacterium]